MNKTKSYNSLSLSWLPYFVFFTGVFIYFCFFADYIFFYQEKSSLFIFSHDFLSENLHQPGGPLIYAGKFLTTFFYYPFAGALIVATVLTLIVLLTLKIIIILNGTKAQNLPNLRIATVGKARLRRSMGSMAQWLCHLFRVLRSSIFRQITGFCFLTVLAFLLRWHFYIW